MVTVDYIINLAIVDNFKFIHRSFKVKNGLTTQSIISSIKNAFKMNNRHDNYDKRYIFQHTFIDMLKNKQ